MVSSAASIASAAGTVTPSIAVEEVTKRYGGRAVVERLSFTVAPGEVFALLGPNGAGKTTTVEMLEGYRAPDGGRVRVLGLDPRADGATLKRRMGLMLQGGGVYPQIRPLEVLRLYAAFYPQPQDAEALLRRVGLEDARRTPFRRLSGGQKQRLSLALALVGRPEVVFLDEPTAAMDPQARRATWEIIRDLKERGVTVLLTTHSMDEAERLADRIAIVDRGRLVALDTAGALRRAGGGAVVRFQAVTGLDTGALAATLAAPVAEVEPGVYAVDGAPSPLLIARLAGWLNERDVLLAELQVGQRSLEEVYLRLTGDSGAPAGP